MSQNPEGHWLLISVSTAGAAQSLRMFVWRRLRGLGAVYLQQSVCLLPDAPRVAHEVDTLLERVARDGGTGRCTHITTTEDAETDELVAKFTVASADEYTDLLERLPEFFAELERETARGRATFAEVEENEADLERYRTWATKIATRDYFNVPEGDTVRAELNRAAESLKAFEELAVSREAPELGID